MFLFQIQLVVNKKRFIPSIIIDCYTLKEDTVKLTLSGLLRIGQIYPQGN